MPNPEKHLPMKGNSRSAINSKAAYFFIQEAGKQLNGGYTTR